MRKIVRNAGMRGGEGWAAIVEVAARLLAASLGKHAHTFSAEHHCVCAYHSNYGATNAQRGDINTPQTHHAGIWIEVSFCRSSAKGLHTDSSCRWSRQGTCSNTNSTAAVCSGAFFLPFQRFNSQAGYATKIRQFLFDHRDFVLVVQSVLCALWYTTNNKTLK